MSKQIFLIFDYDGVIVDNTLHGHRRINLILAELGLLPVPASILRKNWGKKLEDIFTSISKFSHLKENDLAYLKKRYCGLDEVQDSNLHSSLDKNLVNTLALLRKHGCLIGIVTSRDKASLEKDTNRIGLDVSIFHYIQTASDWPAHKPDGNVFKPLNDWVHENTSNSTETHTADNQILYFGDTINTDYAAVKNACSDFAPIKFVGVCSGVNTFEEFIEAGLNETEIVPSHDCLNYYLKRLVQAKVNGICEN